MSKPFENLIAINRNKNGDYYFLYKVPAVPRGMHGKNKGHVDEILIVGIPQSQLINYLRGELTKKTCELYVEGEIENMKLKEYLKAKKEREENARNQKHKRRTTKRNDDRKSQPRNRSKKNARVREN